MNKENSSKEPTSRPPTSPRRTFLARLLLAFLLLSVLPLCLVGLLVSHELEAVRALVDETALSFEHRASAIGSKVQALLEECERDLRSLAELPRTDEAYLAFVRERQREVWRRTGTNEKPSEERLQVPLYKEVSFIDPSGQEQVLILRSNAVGGEQRRDVSDPKNTTYRSETYFAEAMALPPGGVYVSHLTGFHVNAFGQLGLERVINRLRNVDAQTKRTYRFLMFTLLQAAGEVELINSFPEEGRLIRVYRVPGEATRILVEDPGPISPEELQTRELQLKDLIEQLQPEDVVEGETYDGVIRFATVVSGPDGKPAGVVQIALDHLHLAELTSHVKAMVEDAVVFAGYRDADYTYLFDDEGWIITHPKLWNIRGVDRRGQPLAPLTDQVSRVERLVGRNPVNLLHLDWKMGEGYHAVVLETREGKTGIASAQNLSTIMRTRIYSPIFYNTGAYKKYGVFGGVMLGTQSQTFIHLLSEMNSIISERVAEARRSLIWPLLGVLVLVASLSALIARGLVQPLRTLGAAARRIGGGDLEAPIPRGRPDEIGDLAASFAEMTQSLKRTIVELQLSNRELQAAQAKLLEAEHEKQRRLERQVEQLQKEIESASFSGLIAESPQMKKIQEEIVRVSSSNATVLVLGENGTGKEVVAEAIHRNSPRRDRQFLKINCAAFNESLLESELFGHTRGAFTGATQNRKGLFESADGGTLLLDEIGDMSLEMQKKLLRTLQVGEVVPLGSNRVLQVDVRLIAATNRDLQHLMREGLFREDLYHRLNVITILVPPLRERKEDILPLARLFLQRCAKEEDGPTPKLSPAVQQQLLTYQWPGNVRELEHAVERAMIRSRDEELQPEDFQLDQEAQELPLPFEVQGAPMTLDEVERAYILHILKECGGNKRNTAAALGIGYNTLWRKLKKFRVE